MEGEISQVESESNPSGVKVIDVIPVELVDGESYQTFRTVENVQRTKYYKQTYRRAWEQMPDFAGWLTAVEDEPTRAFCIYCQKTLHAHRLSLLKHTCTIRHQKAAQLHQIRKIKPIKGSHNQDSNTTDENETYTQEDDEEMEEVQSEVVEEEEDEEGSENYVYLVKEDEDGETEEIHLVQDNKATSSSQQTFPHISTQVTDAVRGCPVSGLAISLYKLIEGKWTYINEGYTNHEGRFSKFIEGSNFTSGRYKLHYDVDKYFESKKQSSLYPFIEIVFDCKSFNTNYHIPLILSPNGYTTFRGSL